MHSEFSRLVKEYDDVFDKNISGYNSAAGPFEAVVNMGPVRAPQRKGRLPQYAPNKLFEIQHKFDELESLGIFQAPENLGITVEYLNPSFLIKKPSGGHRLVTAFADVGRYSKPQPSLLPDVDSTLRTIAKWMYIIVSDLTSTFYQIPLAKGSMKYCGVVTSFRGVRVYTRSAMGMPGSETALEELMCRILGDCLEDGIAAKLADDLYCGADSPEELLINWKRILDALQKCNEPKCQICNFISTTEDSVVRSTSVQDVHHLHRLPFTTRSAWIQIQSECPDLRRTHAHLKQGTRPSKKLTNVKDVKRYLTSLSIAKDGLLVVRKTDPLSPSTELIVVPRSVLDGLVTALHIKLNHPSKHQLQLVMRRNFFALDMPAAIARVSDTCHMFASLKKLPPQVVQHSTEEPPKVVGVSFAADVLKRYHSSSRNNNILYCNIYHPRRESQHTS
jgi:hypothetical protein